MNDKRPILALIPLALLAACQDEPADDGRAASGEVLEGTVSDAMLPLDRVRSEAPLEDPEAFAEVQEEAAEAAAEVAETAESGEGDDADAEAAGAEERSVEAPTSEAEGE